MSLDLDPIKKHLHEVREFAEKCAMTSGPFDCETIGALIAEVERLRKVLDSHINHIPMDSYDDQ